jgi:hypothetical protein
MGVNTSRTIVVHAHTLEELEELEITDQLHATGFVVPVFSTGC